MDTTDLSEEAYQAIIIEAERFSHDLTLQFGLLSYECQNEEEYLDKSILLISKMKKFDKIDLEDMFFGNPPRMDQLHQVLDTILANIEDVKKIPIEQRNNE
jgi:hypothetical protein